MAGHPQTTLLMTSKLFSLVDAHYTLIYAQPYSWNQYHNSNTRHNRYCMWLGSILNMYFTVFSIYIMSVNQISTIYYHHHLLDLFIDTSVGANFQDSLLFISMTKDWQEVLKILSKWNRYPCPFMPYEL